MTVCTGIDELETGQQMSGASWRQMSAPSLVKDEVATALASQYQIKERAEIGTRLRKFDWGGGETLRRDQRITKIV